MIESAKEFIELREANDRRATYDETSLSVWYDVIKYYPDYKSWIIHNKTIQIEILEFLSKDSDSVVRSAVARKRKINDEIFSILKLDESEDVRYALICNRKLSNEKLMQIKVDDSDWLKDELGIRLSEE